MKVKTTFILLLFQFLYENEIQYFQQMVKFEIDVTLNDSAHTLSAYERLEYANITVISTAGSKDFLEYVIMHEVGHNWFYGILGSNERDHTWMDKGLNE